MIKDEGMGKGRRNKEERKRQRRREKAREKNSRNQVTIMKAGRTEEEIRKDSDRNWRSEKRNETEQNI